MNNGPERIEDIMIECDDCKGAGYYYSVGDEIATKTQYDAVMLIIPQACCKDKCDYCGGSGEVIQEEYEYSDGDRADDHWNELSDRKLA